MMDTWQHTIAERMLKSELGDNLISWHFDSESGLDRKGMVSKRKIINIIANERNTPQHTWLLFPLHAFSCSQISVAGKRFRLLCYKKEAASFSFSTFPPLPHKDLTLRFHFARRKESKHLYKNNQNNDSQALQGFEMISLFWEPSRDYVKSYVRGEKKSVQLEDVYTCWTHIHGTQAGLWITDWPPAAALSRCELGSKGEDIHVSW